MKQEQFPDSGRQEPQAGSFDFDQAQFEHERSIVAKQYKVLNEETLTLKDGRWYKDGEPVEEWAALFDEDDSQYRFGRH